MKERMKSSQYDPYRLGYTRATRVSTKRRNYVNKSKSLKLILVQIILCNSRIWRRNR